MAVTSLTQGELDEIYAFAVDLGRKAGKLLMERVEQRISGSEGHSQKFEEKDNAVDIVTQTDEGEEFVRPDQRDREQERLIGAILDVEMFIRNALQSRYPNHKSVFSFIKRKSSSQVDSH